MKQVFKAVKIAVLAGVCWGTSAQAQHASYHYFSEPGNYIGQGQSEYIEVPLSSVQVIGNMGRSDVMLIFTQNGARYQIHLGAPAERSLEVGTYYFAEHTAFRTGRSPGLNVSQQSRACNAIWGSFSIQQIEFDANNKLQKLEANFSQQCEREDSPALFGYLTYNTQPLMLSLRSEAGDYVGQGVSKDYFNDTSRFSIRGDGRKIVYQASGLRDNWYASIAAPSGTQLQAGHSYTTSRFATPSTAGFDFTGNGRGCNGSRGTLNVHQLGYDSAGKINAMWADFEQYCDNSPAPLRGTIHIGI